jgi:hypothetical protein
MICLWLFIFQHLTAQHGKTKQNSNLGLDMPIRLPLDS